jgi:hypothetical protein
LLSAKIVNALCLSRPNRWNRQNSSAAAIFYRSFSYGIPMPEPLPAISISYAAMGKYPTPTTERHWPVDVHQDGTPARCFAAHHTCRKEQPVLDVILLAGGLGLFALSIAYAFACDRL